MPEKKKREYTFRKGQVQPYKSGSPAHQIDKAFREMLKPPKKVRKK